MLTQMGVVMKRWQSSLFGKTITWLCTFALVLSGFSALSLTRAYGDTEQVFAFALTDEDDPSDELGPQDGLELSDENDPPDIIDPLAKYNPPAEDDLDDFDSVDPEANDESDDDEYANQEAESGMLESVAITPLFIGIEPLAVTLSNNAWANNYTMWSKPVLSYLTRLSSGNFERVEWIGGNLVVEQYTSGYVYVSDKVIAASTYRPSDLLAGNSVLFLGYFPGASNNYVATGQVNDAESNSLTVLRITKYTKDWVYVSNYELKGANTVRVGDFGSLRMVELGGNLYIRTCHLMYGGGGVRHQANMTIVINQTTMAYVEGFYGIMNINEKYGYVSHSFNQFIGVLNGKFYGVDHGDAHPRAVSLKSIFDSGAASHTNVFSITGTTGNNYTYTSVGGFETSNTRQTFLVAGTSADQSRVATSSTPWTLAQNVWLTVTSANLATTNRIAITNYADSDTHWATTPQLIKITEDRFMILWGLGTGYRDYWGYSSFQTTINYIFVDGNGNKLTSIYSATARLSDCQPIVAGNLVTWYVTGLNGATQPSFYSIDTATGAFKDYVAPVITTVSLPEVTGGNAYNQTLAAFGTAPITWSITSMALPPGLTLSSSGVISGTPTVAGTYYFTVQATNSLGSTTKEFFIKVNGTRPSITGPTSMTLPQGYAATSSTVFTPAGTPAPSVTKTSGNNSITWNNSTKKLDIAAGLAPGSYAVVLTASNGVSPNATITFTLTVTAAPGITGPTSMTLTQGYTATSTTAFTVTGFPVPNVTKTSGSSYITWNNSTKRLDIAAGLAAGSYSVVLTASNGVSPNATITFTLTVNAAPGITGPTSMTLTQGYTATSSAVFTITGFPVPNVAISSSSGYITWNNTTKKLDIAAGLTAGSYSVVLTASNGISPNATITFTLTVNATSTITPNIVYRTHVQNIGNQAAVSNGDVSGTSGMSYRLEGIWIGLTGTYSGGVSYRTHVQNVGWQGWVSNNAMSGTSGQSLRLEAIQIRLDGDVATKFDIYYRVHCESYGWLGWAKNGEFAGSEGLSLRLEAIQIVLVTKGGPAPTNLKGITSLYSNGYISGALYRTHVQSVGWQDWVGNGALSGTSGRSLRLEGIEIRLTSDISGGISYRTHVESIGWQGFVSNGAMSGTSGRSLRLEAIEINLTGAAATTHDVWYRVHIQDYGWLGWAKNGAPAGSEGKSKRLEAIQIVVLPKGSPAPGSTAQPFIK